MRCLVTGLGILSTIACSYDELVTALHEGTTRFGPIGAFDVSELEFQTAGEIEQPLGELLPEGTLDPSRLDRYGRFTQLALVSVLRALDDAGLRGADFDPDRTQVVLATSIGPSEIVEQVARASLDQAAPASHVLAQQWVQAALHVVVDELGLECEGYAIAHGCSAANYGMLYGARDIAAGERDVVIVIGLDTLSRTCLLAYDRFGILAESCRPFDANRQGMVTAEGAGVVVLESEARVKARGARAYAEIVGGATTSDAHEFLSAQPDGDALVRAMHGALAASGLSPDDIDYVSAAASGTRAGDAVETRALQRVFAGARRMPPVSSPRGQTGHTHGATGTIEAATCIVAIREGVLPATVGLLEPDEACEFDLVPHTGRRAKVNVAISNGTGFGGADASLIIRAVEPS